MCVLGCAPRSGEFGVDQSFDAGAVFVDSTREVRHAFEVRNPLSRPLRITEVRKSCTCTEATLGTHVLQPGESTWLEMKVDVKPILEAWNVGCTLITDDRDRPEWNRNLRFRTYPRLRFERDTIHLGEREQAAEGVAPHQQLRKSVWLELYEHRDQPTDPIASIEARKPLRVVEEGLSSVRELENGAVRQTRRRIEVELGPTDEQGSGTYVERVLGRTASGVTANLTAAWSVKSALLVSPPRVSFGLTTRETLPKRRTVVVEAVNGPAFQLRLMDWEDGLVHLEGSPIPNASTRHELTLILKALPDQRRFATGRVTLGSDHPQFPKIEIAWSAILKEHTTSAMKSTGP